MRRYEYIDSCRNDPTELNLVTKMCAWLAVSTSGFYHWRGIHQTGSRPHSPASVHYGTAAEIRAQRALTLDAAYTANPTRFTPRPQPPKLPTIAWINEPLEEVAQSA